MAASCICRRVRYARHAAGFVKPKREPTVQALWTPSLAQTMMCAALIVGAVMDIVVWLRSLGLGKYEAVFRENEMTERVLPSLTPRT